MAIRRGEAQLAAEAASQADRARAEISRAQKDREEAARQRASLTAPPQQERAQEILEQRIQTEENRWRKMELEDELDDLKRRMKRKDGGGPSR
jgi:LPS O-antigen subunit length determinant protein (WzzB/FepE family)